MPRVCPACGEWCEEEPIDPQQAAVICTFCQHAEPFLKLPLFFIVGASGAGKTTLSQHLPATLPQCVTLDTDILWGTLPATEKDGYRSYSNLWLHIAMNIGQSGRPVVLCGSMMPPTVEACPHRRYFSTIHYLALVCDNEVLEKRLRARPAWRIKPGEDLTRMLNFNNWYKSLDIATNPTVTIYDTTQRTVEETLKDSIEWIQKRLSV